MKRKKVFITGITGQDGSYMADLLFQKGYDVYGLIRYSSVSNKTRISHLTDKIKLCMGDIADSLSLLKTIQEIEPDEIYNFAALSHVGISQHSSAKVANINGLGVLSQLEIIKNLGLTQKTKFYQASTSDIFSGAETTPQNENTIVHPVSYYGCAKLYAYWIVKNFREKDNIFAVNGISFGHESPRRGEYFVTRKITKAATRIKLGLQDKLYLGNLSTRRDWGHAKDYVRAMWMMMQYEKPDDYVIATGSTITIRDFCIKVFNELGLDIVFEGEGTDEKGINPSNGKILVEVDQELYRPSEKVLAVGDATKAKTVLGWEPQISIDDIVKEMVDSDLLLAKKELA